MSQHGTLTQPPPRQFKGSVPPTPPGPVIPPTPQPGTLIYDSNIHIDWAKITGQFLKVDDHYGSIAANGKGFHMNASGSPRMYLYPATKELVLEHDGKYGRAYFAVTNYNSRLECDFKLDSCSNNFSFKTRNRHQVNEEGGGNFNDEHNQGGIGGSFHCDAVGNQVEVVHGTNTLDKDFSLSPKLTPDKWYNMKYTVKDVNTTTLSQITELDGKVVANRNISPPKQFFYKSDFDTWSEFWIRLNATSGGKLYIRNLKMYAV